MGESFDQREYTPIGGPELARALAIQAAFLATHHNGENLKFTNRDLRDVDFGSLPLDGAVFTACNFAGRSFAGVSLKKVQFIGCDLRHANFDGADLTETYFRAAVGERPERTLTRVLLQHATFTGNTRFSGTRFEDARLDGANFANVILVSTNEQICSFGDCEGSHVSFAAAVLDAAKFSRVLFKYGEFPGAIMHRALIQNRSQLHGCNFTKAKLSGVTIESSTCLECEFRQADLELATISSSELRDSKFERANFQSSRWNKVTVDGSQFVQCRGLGTGRYEATLNDVHGATRAEYGWWWDWLPWSRIRTVASLPLFGVSYLALIALVTITHAMSWLDRIRLDHVSETAAVEGWRFGGLSPSAARELLSMQLAILALALGATIYRFRCPLIVSEFTEPRWTHELGKPTMRYLAESFIRPLDRFGCAVMYLLGGLWIVGHLLVRVGTSVTYLWPQI